MARYHVIALVGLLAPASFAFGQGQPALVSIDDILKQPAAPNQSISASTETPPAKIGEPATVHTLPVAPAPAAFRPGPATPAPWVAPPTPAGMTPAVYQSTPTLPAPTETLPPPQPWSPPLTAAGLSSFRPGNEPPAPGAGCAPWDTQVYGLWTTNFEFLLWFLHRDKLPAFLYTTNSALSPVPIGSGEVVNSPPAFNFEKEPLPGGRVSVGYWFTSDLDLVNRNNPVFTDTGIEVTAFALAQRSIDIVAAGPTLIRPLIDLNNATASGVIIAAPGIASGVFRATESAELWGLEANGLKTVYADAPGENIRVDLLGGFRFLRLNSELDITSNSVFADDLKAFPALAGLAGNRLSITDSFHVTDSFYGGQIGLNLSYITPCVIASLSGKLALGDIHQELEIGGNQVRTTPGGAVIVNSGGVLAQNSNIGTFTRDRVSLVPEISFKFDFPIGRQFEFYAGYTILGISNVIRPGSQVDPVVDTSQIPNFAHGPATGLMRPGVLFKDEFLVISGLDLGFRIIW